MRLRYLKQAGQLVGLALGALGVLGLVALGLGPRLGGYRTMTVLTASMRPTMPEGSLIVQTPVALAEVGVGDVVTYRIPVEDSRVVTHRVVEVLEAGRRPVVRTKGDANRAPDPWLARLEGERVWRVRLAVPKAGYAVAALRHPLAQRLTLLAVPGLLALVWLRDIWSPRTRRPTAAGPAAPAVPMLTPWPAHPARPARRWSGPLALAALGGAALLAGGGARLGPAGGGRGARRRA